jgi:hypothetical protein
MILCRDYSWIGIQNDDMGDDAEYRVQRKPEIT